MNILSQELARSSTSSESPPTVATRLHPEDCPKWDSILQREGEMGRVEGESGPGGEQALSSVWSEPAGRQDQGAGASRQC